MQEGADPRFLKTSACCKHFAAYSLENWQGMDRYHFDAVVSDEDLAEIYLPAFQSCVEKGRASAMMCSYNAVNGVPSCANAFLMSTVARGEWSFDGYITSDCGAVSNVLHEHGYTNSSAATFGATLPSGMDIGCDALLVQAGSAAQAIAQGDVALADIDAAVAHLLRVRFRLGEFDDPAAQPYAQIGLDVVCSAEHVALARDSARQSLVLLTNPRQLLPLNRSATRSVAVVGPFGNSSAGINGGINYAGIPCGGAATTVADAFAAAGLVTTVALGCDIACASTGGFAAAAAAAAASDLTVVVVGLDETIEDEALDRTYLTLPGQQAQLVSTACAAARGPCVVALMSGGAVDLGPALPAITGGLFYAGFMGGSGAPAFVDTVFGASAPAGRLDQTFYPASFVDAVSMLEMSMRPGPSAFPPGSSPGRGNRFYTGVSAFEFGFGLSYTTWSVSVTGPSSVSLAASRALLARGRTPGSLYASQRDAAVAVASYSVNVTNAGSVDSDYVVLGFLVPPGAGAGGVAQQQLFGFERVRVNAGQTVTVWLGVGARDLTRVARDAEGRAARVAVAGEYAVRVGVRGEPEAARAEARFVAVE
jgi:beta-glucosidase-like glycosyl hydrolase